MPVSRAGRRRISSHYRERDVVSVRIIYPASKCRIWQVYNSRLSHDLSVVATGIGGDLDVALVDWLVTGGTVASGMVSFLLLVGVVADAVTKGWVRGMARSWLGIDGLREDHHKTQVFILDLGSAYNDLMKTVCQEHDIPPEERPDYIKTNNYEWLMSDEGELDQGDFRRGGSGDD